MLFSELKEGMRFKVYSEDNPQEYNEGEIVELWENNGLVMVQFNDAVDSFTWGKPEMPLHRFLIKLEGE